MYNRPHRQNMWCANAWVGAPWACGEARYDESVENYENDITKSYEGFNESVENYENDVTKSYEGFDQSDCNKCSDTNCGTCRGGRERNSTNCGNWDHKGDQCKKGYETGGDIDGDKINRLCYYVKSKCKNDDNNFCSTSEFCVKNCPTPPAGDTTYYPPVDGGISGKASTTFYGTAPTPSSIEADDNYLNLGIDSSCGCNINESDADVLKTWYNAAVNDALFGIDTNNLASSADWNCGDGCGRCYKLTTTGKRADNPSGTWANQPDEGYTINVVATSLCPNVDNSTWCAAPGGSNTYGFPYHFDLQNSFPVEGSSWPGCNGTSCNAEVTFQEIECPDCVKTALKNNCKGTDPADWAVKKDGCKYS